MAVLGCIIVIYLIYKIWQFGHWFFFVNVDDKGRDLIGIWIDNVFNRIYENQSNYINDQMYRDETPSQIEERLKRSEDLRKSAEEFREDLKNGQY